MIKSLCIGGLLIAIINMYGCATEQITHTQDVESQYQHKQISLRGVNFTLPEQSGWIGFDTTPFDVRLGKPSSVPQESYALVAQILYLGSADELLPLAKQHNLENLEPPRYKVLSYDAKIDAEREELCVKAHVIIEDHEVPGRPEKQGPMIQEDHTILCQHPKDLNSAIIIGYSHRYGKNGKDTKQEDTINNIFQSLVFTDLPKRQLPNKTDAISIYEMANKYAIGDGVPQDLIEAIKLIKEAAELGLAEAQHDMGSLYEGGGRMVQDYTKAVKWFSAAAQQGYDKSQNYLGTMYSQGKGVPLDHHIAITWYRRAAEQGYAMAQANLASAYTMGEGVPKDYVLAYMWLMIAVNQGLNQAEEYRDQLSERMTSAQIAEAKKKASQWIEHHK